MTIFKRLFLFIITLLFIAMLPGCASTSLKDGKYRAEYTDFDDNGWKAFVEITVTNGAYSDVKFDYINEDDNRLKTQDENYKEAMLNAGFDTYPEKFARELQDKFLEEQDTGKVEIIAGATHSTKEFKQLINSLQSRMKKGDTSTLIVDNSNEGNDK